MTAIGRQARRAAIGLALLMWAAPAELMAQKALPAGKLQVVGKLPKRNLREGKKTYAYHLVNAGQIFRLRAGGPASAVILVRGEKSGAVTFRLSLGDAQRAEATVEAQQDRALGLFLDLPAGTHEVAVEPDARVLLRPVRVRRRPVAGEVLVEWHEPGAGAEPALLAEPPARVAPVPPPEPKPGPTMDEFTPPKPAAAPPAPPPPPPPRVVLPVAAGPVEGAEEQKTVRRLPTPEPPVDPAGPGSFGQWGLWRTWKAMPPPFGTVALGVSIEYFKIGDFLVDGDDNQRLSTRLTVSGVPMTGLEIAAGASLVTNDNGAYTPAQTRTVGDPFLSVRYAYPVLDMLAIGLGVQALFPSGDGFGALSADGISTRILLAVDVTPLPGLLLSANVGYHFDNSRFVFDHPLNAAQSFSAGVNPHDQALVALGGAYTIGPVAPFLELATAQAVGGGAPGFVDNPSWLTIGARGWPLLQHTLHLVLAVDVGLAGIHAPAGKGRVPPYNVVFGIGYDFSAEPEQVEVHEIVRRERVEVPVAAAASDSATGCGGSRVAGQILDANTGKPIGGARVVVGGKQPVTFLTDPEDGRFASCPTEPGPLKLTVHADGYQEQSQVVLVTSQPETPVVIQVQPAVGETYGVLKGTVRAVTGLPLPALIAIPARDVKFRTSQATGAFEQRLVTGSFDVLISMPGYVTQRRKVKLGAGDVVILNVELDPAR